MTDPRESKASEQASEDVPGDPMTKLHQRIRWWPLLWLTLVWCLLWGEITVGNVVAGLLLGAFVLAVFPVPPLTVGVKVRPMATLVLFTRFFFDMVVASVQVAWLAFRPGTPPRGILVDMKLKGSNELLLTLTAEMVALVPGTVVIDLDGSDRVLTLHVLGARTRAEGEAVRSRVLEQEARVLRAFHPDPESVLNRKPTRAPRKKGRRGSKEGR